MQMKWNVFSFQIDFSKYRTVRLFNAFSRLLVGQQVWFAAWFVDKLVPSRPKSPNSGQSLDLAICDRWSLMICSGLLFRFLARHRWQHLSLPLSIVPLSHGNRKSDCLIQRCCDNLVLNCKRTYLSCYVLGRVYLHRVSVWEQVLF